MKTGMPVRKKKFQAKGIARQLGSICAKLEGRPAKRKTAKRKSAKKKSSTKRSTTKRSTTRRDYSRAPAKKRTVKRRTVRSATGPWMLRDASYTSSREMTRDHMTGRGTAKRRPDGTFAPKAGSTSKLRDPAWFGESRRHAAAARKGAKTRGRGASRGRSTPKRTSGGPCGGRRDPAWFGDSRGHACAGSMSAGRRRPAKKSSKRRDPAWFGESERHSYAAEKGWRKVAKPGWTPARYNPRDPAFSRSVRSSSARVSRPTKSRSKSGRSRNY